MIAPLSRPRLEIRSVSAGVVDNKNLFGATLGRLLAGSQDASRVSVTLLPSVVEVACLLLLMMMLLMMMLSSVAVVVVTVRPG
jgi:hypothetical protein